MTKEQIKTNLNEILDFVKTSGHKIPTEQCPYDSEKYDWIEALNEAINIVEQEPVLDKIKAEIESKCCITVGEENDGAITLHDVFEIIDKYRTHISGKEKE